LLVQGKIYLFREHSRTNTPPSNSTPRDWGEKEKEGSTNGEFQRGRGETEEKK